LTCAAFSVAPPPVAVAAAEAPAAGAFVVTPAAAAAAAAAVVTAVVEEGGTNLASISAANSLSESELDIDASDCASNSRGSPPDRNGAIPVSPSSRSHTVK